MINARFNPLLYWKTREIIKWIWWTWKRIIYSVPNIHPEQYNLCSNIDSRHQPLYRWNNANRPAQQRRPSHQHSNSIDKKRERSTQTRCTYTGSLPRPTKFDPDDPALFDRSPEYTPDIDIGDRPPTLTHEICSGRRPSKKKIFLSAIPEQGRRT